MVSPRIALVISASLLLSACASYSDVQALAPRIEAVSAKPVSEVAGCIMPRARDRWALLASIAPDGPAQVVTIARDGLQVLATVTVAPESTGSRVTYRSTTSAARFREFEGDIAGCL